MRLASALLVFALLTACSSRPEVDALLGPEPEARRYPQLVPFAEFPAVSPDALDETATANAALEARGAALRGRAGAIGSTDVDAAALEARAEALRRRATDLAD